MTGKIIIDGKEIGCPCYIDRPLYRYDKGCLIQSQVFTEQQTKEKPILRCDEIQNCPIKELCKQLKRTQNQYNAVVEQNKSLQQELQAEKKNVKELEEKVKNEIQNTVEMERLAKSYGQDLQSYKANREKEIEQLKGQLQAEKEKVRELEESSGFWGRTTARVQSERDKYKQALEEIKSLAVVNSINTCWTVLTNCDECSEKEECNEQNPVCRLNLIYKKCEVLNNA